MSASDDILTPLVERMFSIIANHIKAKTSAETRQRHSRWRQLPSRKPLDVMERLSARDAKLARRAAAARKAGLLP